MANPSTESEIASLAARSLVTHAISQRLFLGGITSSEEAAALEQALLPFVGEHREEFTEFMGRLIPRVDGMQDFIKEAMNLGRGKSVDFVLGYFNIRREGIKTAILYPHIPVIVFSEHIHAARDWNYTNPYVPIITRQSKKQGEDEIDMLLRTITRKELDLAILADPKHEMVKSLYFDFYSIANPPPMLGGQGSVERWASYMHQAAISSALIALGAGKTYNTAGEFHAEGLRIVKEQGELAEKFPEHPLVADACAATSGLSDRLRESAMARVNFLEDCLYTNIMEYKKGTELPSLQINLILDGTCLLAAPETPATTLPQVHQYLQTPKGKELLESIIMASTQTQPS